MTSEKKTRLKVAPQSVKRLKGKLLEVLRRGRGCSTGKVIDELTPVPRGWHSYFKLAEVNNTFEELDEWIRRKLRCIKWCQWKRSYTEPRT